MNSGPQKFMPWDSLLYKKSIAILLESEINKNQDGTLIPEEPQCPEIMVWWQTQKTAPDEIRTHVSTC